MDAELTRRLLRTRWPECSVTLVSRETQYKEALEGSQFDLILCDYTLPSYNGLAALAQARAEHPSIPFIFLSGTIGEERALEALRAGATDYLIKDRPARLVPAIESALEKVAQDRAHKLAEQKARHQASLLDKAQEAICVTDTEHRISFWNARAERLYGFSAAEVMNRDLRELLYEQDLAGFDAALATTMTEGEWRGELSPTARHGGSISVESFWSRVEDETNSSHSILIIDSDITERKRLEAQLLQSQQLETIGLLAGGIAHDLNNVLAPILTSADLLGDLAKSTSERELISLLQHSAEHGADLVQQLLAFARGKIGQKSEVRMDAVIGSVRALLKQALSINIELQVSLPADLPAIHADATQLRQVLLNLCINARDAMPNGGKLEISGRAVEVTEHTPSACGEVKPGPHVCICVADSGTGIPRHAFPKLFEPFFTTKKSGKGTGLGLANVASIMRGHGGFIQVTSTPGEGSTFSLYFPAVVHAPESTTNADHAAAPPEGRGENILIIDADDAIRTVLEVILSMNGYLVTAVKDVREGLEELRMNPGVFDLIATELLLPGQEGSDVIRLLTAMAGHPKIIALSTFAGAERATRSDALAGVELLRKPITVDGFLHAVRRVLDASGETGDAGNARTGA